MIQKLDAIKVTNGITMTVMVVGEPIVKMVKEGTLKVTEVMIRDRELHQIKLTLFSEQGNGIKKGSKIKIVDASTSQFRGEVSLTIPKWGKIELLRSEQD